jgi:SAM-dependent methyltransferase
LLEVAYGSNKDELAAGVVADVGCNVAGCLAGFSNMGFKRLMAIEPDPNVQEWNRKHLGCETFVGMISDSTCDMNGKCRVVLLRDSLEHHYDPRSTLKRCFEILEPNGYLYLHVPNQSSVLAQYNVEAFDWFEADHLYYFDETSIEYALRSVGFRDVVSDTPLSGWDVEDYKMIYGDASYNIAVEEKLRLTKQGRHLRCIARKPN